MVRKKSRSTLCVLDIGSTKIVCFIAAVGAHGSIEIIGIGHNLSVGIKAGLITDVKAAELAIAQAVESAERMAGERVEKVYVTMSAANSFAKKVHSQIVVAGHEISEKDLQKLLVQLTDNQPSDVDVIHSFALDYVLDGNNGIQTPLRMYGKQLQCNYNLVLAPITTVLNLENCLARCQLEVDAFVHSAYAAGLSCLTEDERNMGVTLLEMGGGSTSIAVFHNSHMVYADAVPLGGINITNDLAKVLSVDFANAERLKTLHGSVMHGSSDSTQFFDLDSNNSDEDSEDNRVSKEMLVDIIKARVEEILELLCAKLNQNAAKQIAGNKIIITGGAAQLAGMKELVAQVFDCKVKLGAALPARQNLSGLADSTSGPSFAVPIGILMHAAVANFETGVANQNTGRWQEMLNWFKENFG